MRCDFRIVGAFCCRDPSSAAPLLFAGAMTACASISLGCSQERSGPASAGAAAAPIQVGEASFYGREDGGEKTASGATFDPRKATAASRTLPFGTKAQVTNLETGKSSTVTITDRGPYAEGRIIDVSPKVAEQLGMASTGVANVAVRPVPAPQPQR